MNEDHLDALRHAMDAAKSMKISIEQVISATIPPNDLRGMLDALEVGDHVFYYSRGSADGHFKQAEERAAIITQIVDRAEGVVSVAVFNPTGLYFNTEVQHGEGVPGAWGFFPVGGVPSFEREQMYNLMPHTVRAQDASGAIYEFEAPPGYDFRVMGLYPPQADSEDTTK